MSIPAWWEELEHFGPYETYRSASGVRIRSFPSPELMDEAMMRKLDKARKDAGIKFKVTSSYRPGDKRAHGKGKAVDVRVRGSAQRTKVFFALWNAGFPRVGVYDKHIHGDTDRTRPLGIWGGKSE